MEPETKANPRRDIVFGPSAEAPRAARGGGRAQQPPVVDSKGKKRRVAAAAADTRIISCPPLRGRLGGCRRGGRFIGGALSDFICLFGEQKIVGRRRFARRIRRDSRIIPGELLPPTPAADGQRGGRRTARQRAGSEAGRRREEGRRRRRRPPSYYFVTTAPSSSYLASPGWLHLLPSDSCNPAMGLQPPLRARAGKGDPGNNDDVCVVDLKTRS